MQNRSPSALLRLYLYIRKLKPGEKVTMIQMMIAADVDTPQTVRNMLCLIRRGEVANPDIRGGRLAAIPVFYNRNQEGYFRMDQTTAENVENLIPGGIFKENVAHILQRVKSIKDSFIPGLQDSVEAQLLEDEDIMALISQLGEERLWELEDTVKLLARAHGQMRQRELAEYQRKQLPPGS